MYVTRPTRKTSLEEDFIQFAIEELGAKSLDEDGDKVSRPDFLLDGDTLIELKTLKTPPQHKVENILEPERSTEEWPLVFGQITPRHFEGTEIYERNKYELLKAVQSAVRNHLKKANKQIRAYCSENEGSFGSIVIILNENLSEYSPEMVMNAISRELKSAEDANRSSYDKVNSIVYITEKHFVAMSKPPYAAYFLGHLLNSDDDKPIIQSKTVEILDVWCRRVSSPILSVFRGDGAVEAGEIQILDETMPQSEAWKVDYRKHRSMAGYTQKRLTVEFCKCMMASSLAGLKGSPRAGDRGALVSEMRPFTEVMEELSLRGVDMKEIIPTRSIQRKAIRELRLTQVEKEWLEKNFKWHANGMIHKM